MFVIVYKGHDVLGKYYRGKYIFQGEYYFAFTDNVEEAKLYSSLNRAKLGLNALLNITYMYDLDIEEIQNANTTN